MKWDFDKLNKAEEERSKACKDKWSEENLKKILDKTRRDWYDNYNKEYQDGFEALLTEAGWTRWEYVEEYDRLIGYDIMAGHPTHFMKPYQQFIHGLKTISTYEKNCQLAIHPDRNLIIVRPPSYYPPSSLLGRVCPSDMVDLRRAGFSWDIDLQGFTYWLGPKNG